MRSYRCHVLAAGDGHAGDGHAVAGAAPVQ